MTQTFWLSFCDASLPKGQQFLGACVVDVEDVDAVAAIPKVNAMRVTNAMRAMNDEGVYWLAAAVSKAHRMGCNPGGEVAAMRIDNLPGWAKHKDDHPRGVLLSKAEIEAADPPRKKKPRAAKQRRRPTR